MNTRGLAHRIRGLGAAAMFSFDPDKGRRRRACTRDAAVRVTLVGLASAQRRILAAAGQIAGAELLERALLGPRARP